MAGLVSLLYHNYSHHLQLIPQVGREYTEGVLGQPRFINPILAQTNDADKDIVQLVYSSLFKYDGQANLAPDLVEDYVIEEEGLTYTFYLKKNVSWHDQEPLTADDIIFTIKTIQDPEFKSPLRANWQGVELEKVDDFTVRFKLNNIYAPFLHNLTVGILPKHLWAGISAQNFALAEYNLKPIGSGPYKFKEFSKDNLGQIKSMEFVRNDNFYSSDSKPFIEKIILKFYSSQATLIEAQQKGQIEGMSFLRAVDESKLKKGNRVYQVNLPVYYGVFFNQSESKVLADKVVRTALAYATDKEEILETVLDKKGMAVDSPLLANWPGYSSQVKIYDFALEHAQNILEAANWQDVDKDNIREKDVSEQATSEDQGLELEFTLLTTDWPELEETAKLLKSQWEKIGAKVNLEIVKAASIQQEYIRPRKYQALLFGEVLSADPDSFAFWHSSQRKDPGLNLALYKNTAVDKLLEEARQTLNQEERDQKYQEFQDLIIEDIPAVFLYSPLYLYSVDTKIKGIDIEKLPQPCYRFSQIENWYIKTKIIWQ